MTQEKDKLKQDLKRVAQAKGAQQAVSYQKLFNLQFMQKNTKFATIEAFINGLGIKDFQEIDKLAPAVIDNFVKQETNFNSWQEMQQNAVNQYMTSLF